MRSMFLAVILIWSTSLNIFAQEQKGSEAQNTDPYWAQINQIKPGQKISVHLRGGETLKGAFIQNDERGIVLRMKGNESRQISKSEIRAIKTRSRLKGAGIGFLVGAGVGAALGAAKPSEHFGRGASIALPALGAGAWGTLIGFLAGKERTIYQNPRS